MPAVYLGGFVVGNIIMGIGLSNFDFLLMTAVITVLIFIRIERLAAAVRL